MEARLQALEGNVLEYGNYRQDLGAIVSELASLNSNVRALSAAMVSSLTNFLEKLQHVSKLDADNAIAATPGIGKTTTPPPLPSLGEPKVGERTRCYKRMHVGSRGKEVVREPSPPPSENTEATPVDEGAGGSTSPGSDCALISPPAKATKPAMTPRKRPSANAQGKALGKEMEAVASSEDPPATATALTAAPAKKVSNPEIVFANLERPAIVKPIATISSPTIILECVQNANTIAVITARRQVRVPECRWAEWGLHYL
jgi:hypothetical protein